MEKANLSNIFQNVVDNKTTVHFAAFVTSSKVDDSASMQVDINRLSGGKNAGFGMTFYFSAEFAKEHAAEIAKVGDPITYTIMGMSKYYRGRLTEAEKKAGIELYNLIQAMNIARSAYKDSTDLLDQYWNLRMGSKKEGTKLRSKIQIGSMGDHVHFRRKDGSVSDKTSRLERGSGLTMITAGDLEDFRTKSDKIQAIYEAELAKMNDWSDVEMLNVMTKVSNQVANDSIYVKATELSGPLDEQLVKDNLSKIAAYMNKDASELFKMLGM